MAEHGLVPEDLYVGDVRLRLWHVGEPDPADARARVLMLHGMRDVSRSLLPIAEALGSAFAVTLLDQRGHGASDYPSAYSMEHFYYDLYQVTTHLRGAGSTPPLALVGHSLGGQIAARFSGIFPELVNALVLIEGLGPPAPQWSPERNEPTSSEPEVLDIGYYRTLILDRFAISAKTRALPSVEFAAERLRINNPRLSADQALLTARVATRMVTDDDGQQRRYWAFDPRVVTAFVNFSTADSERLWQAVRCPTLTITGDLSHEYWRTAMLHDDDYSGRFAPGEYAARIAHFADVEHQQFEHSGHMVHFDEPERLAHSVREFLVRKLAASSTAG